jgi:hypothetical protein
MDLAEQVQAPHAFGRLAGRAMRASAKRDRPTVPRPADGTQHVLVLGAPCDLPPGLADLCAALEVNLIHLTSHHDLPFTLHHRRPIAAICVMDPVGGTLCKALRAIASYDQDMPVLIVTGDDPASLGTVDAAEQLWSLTGLHCVSQAPAPHDLVTFLFQAGRQRNSGRLLPVS